MLSVIVIIPCYNESENIEAVINSLADCRRTDTRYSVSYIIINDCSADETLSVCKQNGYSYIDLPVNLGIGGCVQTGYKYAYEHGYDIAVQMDGDGQHDAGEIEDIIRPILENEADFVIGSRFCGKHEKDGYRSTRMRRIGIAFLSRLIRLCSGVNVYDVTSGFRAVDRKCIELFNKRYAQDYPEPEAILDAAAIGARIKEVPVRMNERIGGESSIKSLRAPYYMIKVSLAVILHRFTHKTNGRV